MGKAEYIYKSDKPHRFRTQKTNGKYHRIGDPDFVLETDDDYVVSTLNLEEVKWLKSNGIHYDK